MIVINLLLAFLISRLYSGQRSTYPMGKSVRAVNVLTTGIVPGSSTKCDDS